MTHDSGGDSLPPHAFEPLPGDGPGAHLDDDLCTDIVAGLLAREALGRVLAHVDACPACETRLMAAAGDWEAIRSRAAAEGWPTVSRPAPSAQRHPDTTSPYAARRLRLLLPLALAAGVLLLLLVRLPRQPRQVEDLSYWIPATGELLKLRAGHAVDADSTFWVGLRAYEVHDIPAATALLSRAHAEGSLDDLRRLHLASLLVNAGRADGDAGAAEAAGHRNAPHALARGGLVDGVPGARPVGPDDGGRGAPCAHDPMAGANRRPGAGAGSALSRPAAAARPAARPATATAAAAAPRAPARVASSAP